MRLSDQISYGVITMDEQKILEAAAKAISLETRPEYHSIENGYGLNIKPGYFWNPLERDDDCARLETKLRICLFWYKDGVWAEISSIALESIKSDFAHWHIEFYKDHDGDEMKARRYASTKLAAKIGGSM